MKMYINKKIVVRIVGYSFGSVVSLELTRILEAQGYKVILYLIDGSPELMAQLVKNNLDTTSDENFQVGVLMGFIDILWPQDKTKVHLIYLLCVKLL